MNACIIVPARYAPTRYPGKPLAALRGANGTSRSLLERSVGVAPSVGVPVFVATDDERIKAEADRIGVKTIITNSACRNGTERVAEAVCRAGIDAEVIVNLQGDAPLTPAHFVTALITAMKDGNGVTTPVLRCDAEALENFVTDRGAGRVGATTVVSNRLGQALYFSKEMIPFINSESVINGIVPVFHHVGLYAYRRKALDAYMGWDIGPLEKLEGLEQLRFLENGYPIKTVEVSAPGAAFWELNNPSDVPLIEDYLVRMGID